MYAIMYCVCDDELYAMIVYGMLSDVVLVINGCFGSCIVCAMKHCVLCMQQCIVYVRSLR